MTFSFVTTHFILLKVDDLYKYRDIMKQPAAILVVPVLYTILVLPVFYQNLPVSAILEDTGQCAGLIKYTTRPYKGGRNECRIRGQE